MTSWLLLATVAYAGGLEYTGQGVQSLARGGAVAAKAEDPMVLAHNPAGLSELRGSQLLLNLNLALFDACVKPSGFYGWGVYLGGKPTRLTDPATGQTQTLQLGKIDPIARQAVAQGYYTDPFDEVCLDQTSTPIPQLAWTRRISRDFGIGFGFIFPSVQPSGRWGAGNGVIHGKNGELRPAPTRYMMLSSNNIGLFPNLGVGYRLMEELRLGFAFEWGMIGVDHFTMAAATGGTNPANDIIAHVKAQDWFIPGFTASVHVVPTDAIDAVVAFRYQDDLAATGDIDLTTGSFDLGGRHFTTGSIPITSLTQHMPWKLRAGLRYADRFAPRASGTGRWEADEVSPDRVHDPLQDERYDLELDIEYQMNGRNDEQVLKYEQRDLAFYPADPMAMPSTTVFPAMGEPDTVIEKRWKDQFSVRLGGSWNAVPGLFGISAGTHYETRGVDPDYMQIDQWPVERLGLHTGVIVRFAKRVDFVLSYAHIFQETIIVAAPMHETRDLIDTNRLANKGGIPTQIDKTVGAQVERGGPGLQVLPEPPQGEADGTARLDQNVSRSAMAQPSYLINAGTYSSNFDVIAAGVNVHF